MAEVNNTDWIGPEEVRPTGWDDPTEEDTQLHKLARYDSSLGRANHSALHAKPASFFVWSMFVITTATNNSKESLIVEAPWPVTIWAADVGCESAGGATGTVDIEVDGASILDAAEAVKATAGTAVRVAPEDGSEEVAYGQTINIVQAGGVGGDMIGGQAHLYCQRR